MLSNFTKCGRVVLFVLIIIVLIFITLLPTKGFGHIDDLHIWHGCPLNSGSYICSDLIHDSYADEITLILQ